MGLTLAQRFGSNATINESTPANPKLVIQLKDLSDVTEGGDVLNEVGFSGATFVTAADANDWADKIAAALLILWRQTQPATNEDSTVGVYVEAPEKNFAVRNGIRQIEFNHAVYAYIEDTTVDLDSDAVVTS